TQSLFADIRDVVSDFLRSELRITCTDLELIDVNGSVNVFLHDLLRDHDSILEVVAVPWHERDEYVATERQLAMIGVRPIGDDLTALHMLAFANDRFLIHAGTGVRPHEFPKLVNVDPSLGNGLYLLFALGQMTVLRDDNLVSSD